MPVDRDLQAFAPGSLQSTSNAGENELKADGVRRQGLGNVGAEVQLERFLDSEQQAVADDLPQALVDVRVAIEPVEQSSQQLHDLIFFALDSVTRCEP